MRLKTMENVDKGKEKNHVGKLTSNPEDRTPYISHVMFDKRFGHAAAVLNKRYLSKRRFRVRVIYILFSMNS